MGIHDYIGLYKIFFVRTHSFINYITQNMIEQIVDRITSSVIENFFYIYNNLLHADCTFSFLVLNL